MVYWDQKTKEKIRKGYFSAVYFNRTKYILEKEKNYKVVTMQIFQKKDGAILCGVNEVIELLKIGTGYYQGKKWINKWNEVTLKTLKDGDRISAWETVMHLSGPYLYFAHLESLYLGILSRRTLVATNTKKIVDASFGKPVIFFGDRFDHFFNQEGDGYAAHTGGAFGVCTPAHAAWWNGQAQGTIPHSLIAINFGDTVKAAELFEKYFEKNNFRIIALVDFDNDCVKTALEVAYALKDKLWGIRLDTAENIVDKSIKLQMNKDNSLDDKNRKYYGVNPTLVKLVRRALDKEGFTHVKIVVSGGFNEQKVKWFEKEKAPVDFYGVGSAIVHGENDFTADVVMVEGKKVAKAGREYKENPRLKSAS